MIGDCGLQIQRVSFWSSPFMGALSMWGESYRDMLEEILVYIGFDSSESLLFFGWIS